MFEADTNNCESDEPPRERYRKSFYHDNIESLLMKESGRKHFDILKANLEDEQLQDDRKSNNDNQIAYHIEKQFQEDKELEKTIKINTKEEINIDANYKVTEIDIVTANTLKEKLIDCHEGKKPMKLFDQLIEDIGYGREQWIIIIVTGMNFILQGIYFFINSAMYFPVQNYYNISDTQMGLASSMIYLSGIGTCFMLGYLSNLFGRLKLVYLTTLIVIISHLGICLINNFIAYCVFIFIIGGMLNINSPILINILAEFLPIKYRAFTLGAIWGWYFIGSIFLLLFYLFYMPTYTYEKFHHILWILLIFPVFTYILTLTLLKNSPRSMILSGKEKEGIKLLSNMYKRTKAYTQRKKHIISENYNFNQIDITNDNYSDIIGEAETTDDSDKEKNEIIVSDDQTHKDKVKENLKNCKIEDVCDTSNSDDKNSNKNNNVHSSKKYSKAKGNITQPGLFSNKEIIQIIVEVKILIILKDPDKLKNKANIKDIFSLNYIKLTLSLAIVWLSNSIVSYGPFLIMPLTIKGISESSETETEVQIIISQLWVTAISLFANPLGGYLCELEILGRKHTSSLSAILCSVVCVLIFLNISNIVIYMTIISILNTLSWNSINTYTAEVYPTYLRNMSVGFMNSIGNSGSMISQPLFVFLNSLGLRSPYLVASGFSFCSFINVMLFPYETRGKELDFDVEDLV